MNKQKKQTNYVRFNGSCFNILHGATVLPFLLTYVTLKCRFAECHGAFSISALRLMWWLLWKVCWARWADLYSILDIVWLKQDSSLGPSFIVSNITKSDQISNARTFLTKSHFPFQSILLNILHLTKYLQVSFSFMVSN